MTILLEFLGPVLRRDELVVTGGLLIVIAVTLCFRQTFADQLGADILAFSYANGSELAGFGRAVSQRDFTLVVDGDTALFSNREIDEALLAFGRVRFVHLSGFFVSETGGADTRHAHLLQYQIRRVRDVIREDAHRVPRENLHDGPLNLTVPAELGGRVPFPDLEGSAFGHRLRRSQRGDLRWIHHSTGPIAHASQSVLEQLRSDASSWVENIPHHAGLVLVHPQQLHGELAV
mmetsp:Transcript_16077/g.18488  ORF Transcript_16077/g.18488 Transcript_16077/m.18488 type:complete len:233 (-) Transcript_16077:1093-1791(-)